MAMILKIGWYLLNLALIIVLKTGYIFLIIALLPSVAAYYTDHLKGRPQFQTVSICNLAATLPYLLPILDAGLKFESYDVMGLCKQPMVWLVIYGGAAAGWALIYLCSMAARFAVVIMHDYRVEALEKFQKKLIEEWGDQVTKE